MSMELMVYCFVFGGIYLALSTAVLRLIERLAGISRGLPESLLEPTSPGWHILNYVMELLFFVAVPTLAYGIFSVILPLTGVRTGLAVALAAFTLGAVPAIIGLSVRMKLPMPYLLYFLVGLLVKLAGSLAIIGYLYSL